MYISSMHKEFIFLLINNKDSKTMFCWILDFENLWFSGVSRGYKIAKFGRNEFLVSLNITPIRTE